MALTAMMIKKARHNRHVCLAWCEMKTTSFHRFLYPHIDSQLGIIQKVHVAQDSNLTIILNMKTLT